MKKRKRDVTIVEKIAGVPGQIVVTKAPKDKLSCVECQHFRLIHTIRGCRAPRCTCTRKGDQ